MYGLEMIQDIQNDDVRPDSEEIKLILDSHVTASILFTKFLTRTDARALCYL